MSVTKRKAATAIALFGIIGLIVITWFHAWRMTHFVESGLRTKSIERQSFFEKVGTVITGVNIPKPQHLKTPADVGLKYKTLNFTGFNGLMLEAWQSPGTLHGAYVLMFHGYSACKDQGLEEAKRLNEMGWNLLMVDFYGSGGSEGDTTSIGYYESHDVEAAVEYARSKLGANRVILYGQSMGAAAILTALGRTAKGVDGAILVYPFGSLLETVSNRFRLMGLPVFPFAHLLVAWGGLQHGFNGFSYEPAEYARAIESPILYLHGAGDTRVKQSSARRIFDNLPGKKRFIVFENAGHGSLTKSDPKKWDNEIGAFVKELL